MSPVLSIDTLALFQDRFEQMWEAFLAAVPGFIVAAVILAITFVAARIVKWSARSIARSKRARGPALLVARLWSGAIIVIGILVALAIAIPSLDFAAALGALGLGGIVIGFALKDIVQNFLAGILILFNRPFRIGDQIRTSDHEGTVEDIQVRATLLRTYDNRRIVIPNSELFTNRVTVLTAYDQVRQAIRVSVPDEVPIKEVRSLILHRVAELEEVLDDPSPQVLVRDLEPDATVLEVRFWVDPPIRRELILAEDAVLTALHEEFDKAGLSDIVPVQRVIVEAPEAEQATLLEGAR